LRDQFPEWSSVETREGEGDAAGLAEWDDSAPVEVEEFIQFNKIDGNANINLYAT